MKRNGHDSEPPRRLRCATVQFQPRPADKDYNLERVRSFVDKARAHGVQLVSFPEMCTVGYWHRRNLSEPQLRELAEPLDGPTVSTVRDGEQYAERVEEAQHRRLWHGADASPLRAAPP